MMHYTNSQRAVFQGEFTLLSRGPTCAHGGIPSSSGPPTHWDDGEHIGTQLVSRCAERLESLNVQARGLKLYRSPLGSYIQDTRSITWKTGTEPENDREGFLNTT